MFWQNLIPSAETVCLSVCLSVCLCELQGNFNRIQSSISAAKEYYSIFLNFIYFREEQFQIDILLVAWWTAENPYIKNSIRHIYIYLFCIYSLASLCHNSLWDKQLGIFSSRTENVISLSHTSFVKLTKICIFGQTFVFSHLNLKQVSYLVLTTSAHINTLKGHLRPKKKLTFPG